MDNQESRDLDLRVTLLPRDTNKHGSIFGGIITSHIDLAGAVQARKSCGPFNFVTVAMDKVVFHKPVFVGDVVSFYARTVKVGRTSVAIKVEVDATRVETQETVRVTEAEIVFAHLDDRFPGGELFEPADLLRTLRLLRLYDVGRTRDGRPQLDTRFPPGSLEGLALEVVSFGPCGAHTSATLALEPIARSGFDAFWTESTGRSSQAWGRSGQALTAIGAGDVQFSGLAMSAAPTRAPHPTHVPVVTPADRRNGDVPPRLEKKPLPVL